jgi:carboxyl-terminal processing protease
LKLKTKNRSKIVVVMTCIFAMPAGIHPVFAQVGETPGKDQVANQKAAQLTLDDLRTFTDVFNQVRRNYVEEVDDRELLDAAIRGMLMDLDPHSEYLPKPEYKDLDDSSKGRYSGIGISVLEEDQKVVVKAVINGSPADEAGLNPGDVITSIDGKAVKGRFIPEAIDELMGEPETEVLLTVLPPEGEEREVQVQREYLKVPTLSYRLLENSYGYFKISGFHRESAIHLEESLQSIKDEGTVLGGLVIDLRNNPGGVLQPAVAMADGFLDDGLILSTRGRNSTMQMEFKAHPGQWLEEVPLLILVDRGTASASEVLAGALQDHGRALIVGERTFGKGSVQSVLPLRNGAGIKLTTARYYTPSGRSIQAQGIEPDVVLKAGPHAAERDHRVREADLDRHLDQADEMKDGNTVRAGSAPEDIPVDEVIAALRAEGILRGGQPAEPADTEE